LKELSSWSELESLFDKLGETYLSLDLRVVALRVGGELHLLSGRALPLPTKRARSREKVSLGHSLVLLKETVEPQALSGLMEAAPSGLMSVAGSRIEVRPISATVSKRLPWLESLVWMFPFPLFTGELTFVARPPQYTGPVVVDGRAYEDLTSLLRQEVVVPEGIPLWEPGRGFMRFLLPIYAAIIGVKVSGGYAVTNVLYHEALEGRVSLLPALRGEGVESSRVSLEEVSRAGSLVRAKAKVKVSGSEGGSLILALDDAPVDQVSVYPRRVLSSERMSALSHFDRGLWRLRSWLRQSSGMDGRNFEYAVSTLLYALGFDSLWVGYMPADAPDVVALGGNSVLLVECTVAPPKPEKIAILAARAEDLSYATRMTVTPVLFFVGDVSELDPESVEEARNTGVVLVDSGTIEALLRAASSGSGPERALEIMKVPQERFSTYREGRKEILWEWLRDDLMPEVRVLLRRANRHRA